MKCFLGKLLFYMVILVAYSSNTKAQSGCVHFDQMVLVLGVDASASDPEPTFTSDHCNEEFFRQALGDYSGDLLCSARDGQFSAASKNRYDVEMGEGRFSLDADLVASNVPVQSEEIRSEASSTAVMNVVFTVIEDTRMSLTANLRHSDPWAGFSIGGMTLPPELSLKLISPEFPTGHVFERRASVDGTQVFETFDVVEGNLVALNVSQIVRSCGTAEPCDAGNASIFVELDICDADGDGLLDHWEIDGIDINGDGNIDLDLPALGADPLRKDLFVEVDVHAGTSFPATAVSDVVAAFENAPVPNPDGSTGITLHLDVDETSIPARDYSGPRAALAAAINAQRQANFGTSAQRNHPDRDLLLEAKRQVYRYGVVGGTFTLTGDDGSPLNPSGFGEIPGDDFIVTPGGPEPFLEGDMARVFMHELGHTLGLDHGGADDVNYKPNYHSVMNYMYQMRVPDWGARWNSALFLDYSRDQLPQVDEGNLNESIGIGSNSLTSDGKFFIYNNPAPIVSPANTHVLFLGDASPVAPVDWNGDNDFDDSGISLNINNIANYESGPDEKLNGHDDWSNLRLRLGRSGNFAAGAVATGYSTLDSGEFTSQDRSMLSGFTLVEPVSVLFRDGFETRP